MVKKTFTLALLWVLALLGASAYAQTKPGWQQYSVDDGRLTFRLPNTLTPYFFKDKTIKATPLGDGTVAVSGSEMLLFVPKSEADRDLEGFEVTSAVALIVGDRESGKGLGIAVNLLRKSGTMRSLASWGIKKAIRKHSKGDEVELVDAGNFAVVTVAGEEAVTWPMTIRDEEGREADARVYMLEHSGRGYVLVLMTQKGVTGLTQLDGREILASLTYR